MASQSAPNGHWERRVAQNILHVCNTQCKFELAVVLESSHRVGFSAVLFDEGGRGRAGLLGLDEDHRSVRDRQVLTTSSASAPSREGVEYQ